MRRNCGHSGQNWGAAQDFLNTIFADIGLSRPPREEAEASDWYPAADIYETAEEFVISLDAPGMERDKFDISLDEKHLTVTGERATEGESHRRRERPNGRFTRRFRVHAHVDRDNIVAEYKDGVLRLRLPRKAAPESQRVKINVA